MSIIKLRHKDTKTIIYSGLFGDIKECLEHAICQNIDLSYADLSHANLAHANLDGGRFSHARFFGSNLVGANLSETVLDHADFRNAALQNACLCESALKNVNFEGAFFGGTDIAYSTLNLCRFSTLSAFSLNFKEARDLSGCVFKTADLQTLQISTPPITISGLEYNLILTDNHIIIGGQSKPIHKWLAVLSRPSGAKTKFTRFLSQNTEMMTCLIHAHRPQRIAYGVPFPSHLPLPSSSPYRPQMCRPTSPPQDTPRPPASSFQDHNHHG